jgi:prepilin-type N-terminal cleavage/methylation domain-containing protein
MKKKYENFIHDGKKGFTLVELIVVLVIVSILAAVAIPVLMGYTDDAKEKQYISEGKQALAATQAMLSDAYTNNLLYLPKKVRDQALETSGLDEDTEFVVYTVTNFALADGTTATIGSYTADKALYKAKDGTYVYYDKSGWSVIEANDTRVTNAKDQPNYIKVWKADMTDAKDTATKKYTTAGVDDPENDTIIDAEKDDGNGDDRTFLIESVPRLKQ